MILSSSAAASAAIAPACASIARSCVAGRSTRNDRQVPPEAIGASTACSRTLNWSAVTPVSWPSTHGCASSSRRPTLNASRCASRRTASSSANRMELRRNPFPSSTHTASGAVTKTSVVPSARSSGSRMPTPVSSVCSIRRLLSTSVSPSTPPDSARIAAATTLGRSGADSAASRSRTRSINDTLMRRPPMDAAPTPSALAARRWQEASGDSSADRRAPAFRARLGCGRMAAISGTFDDARHVHRSQSGGRRAAHHEADIRIDRAQRRRDRGRRGAAPTSAVVTSTTKSAASAANSTDTRHPHGADRRPPLRRHVVPHRSPRPTALARCRYLSGHSTARSARRSRGNAWRNAAKSSLPCSKARSGQRNPGLSSVPDHQIDATAPRVGIDEQRIARRLRECGREQRRPGTAAASHHGDDRTPALAIAAGFRGLGQRGDEFGLVDGQVHDVLGADGDRGLPFGGLRFAAAEHDDVGAARQRGVRSSCRRPPRRAAPPMPRSRLAGSADAQRGRRPHPQRRRRGRPRRASPIRRPWRGRRCLRSSVHSAGRLRRECQRLGTLWTGPQLWMK